ncbi:DoxX family protein [Pseudonocardia acaciae]|uniref:DoxX family protein n=1 Tax=Pseudonocardia acaciae TaxID=551276 RepID=UPI00048FAFFA|nr:DoxX family protein [Pseudonocardia acaciae]
MTRPLPASTGDVAVLVARIVLGLVLIAHGLQKLVSYGFAGTSASFEKMGVPLAPVSAAYATLAELGGGILLVLGAATTLASALIVLDMLGAFVLVHASKGVFVDKGGFELVAVIAAGALLLAAFGPGRFSVDHALAGRKAKASA